MGDFFHGWRRKISMITLVMACVFMAGWVRSSYVRSFIDSRDVFTTPYGIALECDHQSFSSMISEECIMRATTTPPPLPVPTTVTAASGITTATVYLAASQNVILLRPIVELPYWSIVIPLTLLSACLLLVKPRKPKPTPQTVCNTL